MTAPVREAAQHLRCALEEVSHAHDALREAGEDRLALAAEKAAFDLDCVLTDVARRHGRIVGDREARKAKEGESDVVELKQRRAR